MSWKRRIIVGLADTFDELFSSDFSKYWGKEYLWTIPGTGGSTGGGSEFPGVILENKGWASTMVGDKLNRHMTFMQKC